MKKIALIVAQDLGGVIGNNNQLPAWKLKDDMSYFKNMTLNNAVIMGRKNFESIEEKFRPLKDRTNIILTRNYENYAHYAGQKNTFVCNLLWKALELAEESPGEIIWIIGGGEIYTLAMKHLIIDQLHITTVQGHFDGDVIFTGFNGSLYEISNEFSFEKNERNSHNFITRRYDLKKK